MEMPDLPSIEQPTFESFKSELIRLAEKYHENRPRFREERFDEASLRIDYLGPFWRALGWDVENTKNQPQSLREVQVESRFYEDRRKRADYIFRTDGIERFVCEAKSPLEDLSRKGAYQSQRYAYNLGVRVATLTNFGRFQIFIIGGKPDPDDPWALWKQWDYTEYETKAREIWDLFSRGAVGANALENTIAALPKRAGRGRQGWLIVPERVKPVDTDFLEYIEQQRALLAADLLKNNSEREWNEHDLNEAVQKIINRILFVRICEDRDIDTGRLLENLVSDWKSLGHASESIYNKLVAHFNRLDRSFNGSLFKKDHFSESLVVSDEWASEFISDLSSEDSPYLFSTLPVEILGSVYERFLGKVLTIHGSRRVTLDIKPELRKVGGIYYTPRYVVNYIVEGALGPHLEGMTPRQIRDLRVVDIACGSGSFLIRALERICEHLVAWYHDNPHRQDKKYCYKLNGELRLTTHAKHEVLLNNIFGLDIDGQAVEITMLSLYLKVLEGETRTTLLQQHTIPGLEEEKYLPDLTANIQCGNAIIGTEYYSSTLAFNDDYVRYKVNPFDWRRGFEAAARAGGFDVVVGNPPYRRELDHKELMDDIAETEFGRLYRSARMDLWYYFVHRGLEMLKPEGVLSFITNSYWTSGTGAEKLITTLRTECHVEELFFLGKLKVFVEVSGQHMMFRIRKTGRRNETLLKFAVGDSQKAEDYVRSLVPVPSFTKSHSDLFHNGIIDSQPTSSGLLRKIEKNHPLSSFGKVRQGIAENPSSINRKTNKKYGNRWSVGEGVFALQADELKKLRLPREEQELVVPYHDLCDLGRYRLGSPSLSLIYSTKVTCPDINDFPHIKEHLKRFSPIMRNRRETRDGSNKWWHLHWPREQGLWTSPKVLCLQMADRPSFVTSHAAAYVSFSVNVFVPSQTTREDVAYFSGLLNSRLLWKWFQHNAKRRGVDLEINGGVLERAPIKRIDFTRSDERRAHDRIVELVTRLEKLGLKLGVNASDGASRSAQREFEALDAELDAVVYKLYELTEMEIADVEQSTTNLVPAAQA